MFGIGHWEMIAVLNRVFHFVRHRLRASSVAWGRGGSSSRKGCRLDRDEPARTRRRTSRLRFLAPPLLVPTLRWERQVPPLPAASSSAQVSHARSQLSRPVIVAVVAILLFGKNCRLARVSAACTATFREESRRLRRRSISPTPSQRASHAAAASRPIGPTTTSTRSRPQNSSRHRCRRQSEAQCEPGKSGSLGPSGVRLGAEKRSFFAPRSQAPPEVTFPSEAPPRQRADHSETAASHIGFPGEPGTSCGAALLLLCHCCALFSQTHAQGLHRRHGPAGSRSARLICHRELRQRHVSFKDGVHKLHGASHGVMRMKEP